MKKASLVLCLAFLAFRASALIDTNLQLQLGNPSGATTDTNNLNNFLSIRPIEAIGYNNSRGQANWASWDLTSADANNAVVRQDTFAQDTNYLPANFYRVLDTEYSGSGYDRGHLCPSADRTDSTNDNNLTFLMSNMMAQAPDNNRITWANLENDCRTIADAGNEVLILCGPSGFNGSHISSSTHVLIASNTWKIVVVVPTNGGGTALSRITTTTNRVIAIRVPNTNGVDSAWQSYITSAHQIELETGFTFFTTLPGPIASAFRAKIDGITPTTPSITSFTPTSGAANTNVVITGTNFNSTSVVKFNGLNTTFIVDSNTQITTVVPTNATTGTLSVTTPGGTATSAGTFTVTNVTPPSIVTGPQSQSVIIGSNATFTVSANGTPPLSYQWRFTGTNIGGATLSSYTRVSAQSADAGSYTVVITNTGGSLTSAVAVLTVNIPPGITTPPQSQTVAAGSNVLFTVTATGTVPLSYQWRFNGANISTATLSSYTRANAQSGDAGSYSVIVTNVAGSITSAVAVLTVNSGPTITTQPQDQTVVIGDDTTFTVAATGTATLNYQWRFTGTNIGGATLSSYTRSNAQTNDAGSYSVVVTNSISGVTSAVAVLTVNLPSTNTVVTLVGWDVSGQTNFGFSPLTPTTNAANISVVGLTRGPGVYTNGSGAARAWGGVAFTNTTSANAIVSNQFVTFSAMANTGYKVSYSAISKWDYRRSGTGATNGLLQYQIGSGAFTDIANVFYTNTTSTGSSIGAIDLSGISALQNVGAGTNVTFRIVNWGGSGSSGTWYVFDVANNTNLDFAVDGVVLSTSVTNTGPSYKILSFVLNNATLPNQTGTFSWETVSNRTYNIERSDNIVSGWTTLKAGLLATGASYTFTTNVPAGTQFFRIYRAP